MDTVHRRVLGALSLPQPLVAPIAQYLLTRSCRRMNRRERHAAIQLVRDRALSTQAEVASALRESGYDVVQTTVSRHIAELGLVKCARRADGSPPGGTDGDRHASDRRLRRYARSPSRRARLLSRRRRRGTRTRLPNLTLRGHTGRGGNARGRQHHLRGRPTTGNKFSRRCCRMSPTGYLLQGVV